MVENENNPVDRLKFEGIPSSSVVDLLAVGFSRSEDQAKDGASMAKVVLERYGKLAGLIDAGTQDLIDLTGLDSFEVQRAKCLIELGRRASIASRGESIVVDLPEDVFRKLSYLKHEKREHFVAVLLDAKGQIIRIAPIHIGTLSMSLVGAREVFREAIREGASSLIVAHNHPSGDPTPSPEDIEVTQKLVDIGDLLDIPLLDHIVIGYDTFTSFSKKGLICKPTGTRS